MGILNLPEDCLSIILSLTTPRDAIRSSATSKRFLSASLSNIVWNNFLPSDIDNVIHQASSPIHLDQLASKKDLFLHLSQFPLLLDNSTKSFGLDKCSGTKCYMIAPRALSITWGGSPEYWSWESVPESRFAECAVLNQVCWLEINGRISTILLSPNTTYGVYFVFKINDGSYGFRGDPVKVTVVEVSEEDGLPLHAAFEITKQCYLIHPDGRSEMERRFILPYEDSEEEEEEDDDDDDDDDEEEEDDDDDDDEEEEEIESPRRENRPFVEVPVVRSDGWMEIEMGRYQVGVGGGQGEGVALEMSLKEVEDLNWKSGLVINGIDLRPLV